MIVSAGLQQGGATSDSRQLAAPDGSRLVDMSDYEFRPIPATTLTQLRTRDDAGVHRVAFADSEGDAPLRCCLTRSAKGEELVLASYAPLRRWAHAAGIDPGAYDEVGPVFVHAHECGGPTTSFPAELLTARRVYRSYDQRGHITGGFLVDPAPGHAEDVARAALEVLFARQETAVVHVRAVEFGCFLVEVARG